MVLRTNMGFPLQLLRMLLQSRSHVLIQQPLLGLYRKAGKCGNKEIVCSGCDELVLVAAYKCLISVSTCSFVIHKSCTELSQSIDHPLHPDHTLYLQWPGRNDCDACCRSHDSSFFYGCHSCDFQLHIKCANRFPINPDDCHQHEFLPIQKRIPFNCEICGEKIMNIANPCSICKLLVHKRCVEISRTIKIKSHNHILTLTYSLPQFKKHDDKFCRICYEMVNIEYAAYLCQDCKYVTHLECANFFWAMYKESPTTGESVPNISVDHTTHLIKALNHVEDDGPHPGEIQHFSHLQHMLILCDNEVNDDKLCEGYMEFIISVPFYRCEQCDFFLHTRCTKLPTRIEQHRLHDFHTFTLLPQEPTKSSMFFCNICSCHHLGFTYKCDTCWPESTLDIHCGSIPESLKHEGHQHSIFLALNSNYRKLKVHPFFPYLASNYRTCKACPEDYNKYVFVCTNCDFILGIRCTNLPLVAKHRYDTHLLKLTYAVENDSKEYYCLICEEERDPDHWFYYCEECNFPAHPKCVIGNYG